MEQLIEKGVREGCLLSQCLFNLCGEHILRNAGLDKLQAEIKIGGRNINNLRYADGTIMAESEEELKSFYEGKGGEWVSLSLNIKETKIIASGPITSWQIEREK